MALRAWFGHDPDRFDEFERRYRLELAAHGEDLTRVREWVDQGRITLEFAARDTKRNNAVVLRRVIQGGSPAGSVRRT